jgi:hypothetical protein
MIGRRVLDVEAEIEIRRDAATVRRQFGDVAYHQRAGVHGGVQFEALDYNDPRQQRAVLPLPPDHQARSVAAVTAAPTRANC